MKLRYRYFRILARPLYVPLVIMLSFFISYFVLLSSTNQDIVHFVRSVLNENGNYRFPVRFTVPDWKKGNLAKITEQKDIAYYAFAVGELAEGSQFLTTTEPLYERENRALKGHSEGIIAPRGYKKLFQTQSIDFGKKTLDIVGEEGLRPLDTKDMPKQFFMSGALFDALADEPVAVKLYLEGFPTMYQMEQLIDAIRQTGVTIENVELPSFETDLLPQYQLTMLMFLFFIFGFLLLNLLFVFYYFLESRKKNLNIFRLAGMSKRLASALIGEEMTIYSMIAFLVAAGTSWIITRGFSPYFPLAEVLVLFVTSTALVYVATRIMAKIGLSRGMLLDLKENSDV